jgi:hypothetical protein
MIVGTALLVSTEQSNVGAAAEASSERALLDCPAAQASHQRRLPRNE